MSHYEFFTDHELRCRCGCGRGVNNMDPGFMDKLVQMRRMAGFPFIVASAYRCPEYNDRISHTGPDGPHTYGKAIDLRTYGKHAKWITDNAGTYGFTGIGFSQKGDHERRFIHLDTLLESEYKGPRPWVWTY